MRIVKAKWIYHDDSIGAKAAKAVINLMLEAPSRYLGAFLLRGEGAGSCQGGVV